MQQDARTLDVVVTTCYDAQITIFPNMVTTMVAEMVAAYHYQVLGWRISVAGGYLILVSDRPVADAMDL